ncbi:tryptophanyl-tRNA synthetase [Anaplasma marginale str. Dawn]|uniref:tryptophan--tRNA ligase n=1 Tax=Anaplasma marginale TaxID=770 RepID=UPI0000497A42|nr:tryptophan--tRNA ligase [Anaplasma marginale]AAV86200.1 tryptophanyl-tRNA synthetase [Anaplasma marginale str. St. Maries]AGZ78500.1 tryptophanyl-tRNA synthetase [Anaplasma marginale str. Gypsy Plains]AGZ79357.1 tryptophanyl-tRNA synthetase [Anaplasma marginale str. Dawn]
MIFSGIQPSGGVPHLGNYLGAIRRWVGLQGSDQCLFCVVDLHALTAGNAATATLHSRAISLLATYIACGIDPEKSVLFVQSSVPEHSELCWILGCVTPMGWLNRMTQFKDKSRSGSTPNMGLYGYPVLMAADILLYKATLVPVGDDQMQHIELTQDIARAFNAMYKVDYFPVPKPLSLDSSARIMSLRDGKKKMSKSDASDAARINLDDDDDSIVQKIMRATTDSIRGLSLEVLDERPEMHNLVNIFAALSGMTKAEVCNEFAASGTKEFKEALAGLLVREISPIREKIRELVRDVAYVDKIIATGNGAARELAGKHIVEIKKIIGLVR